jgi:hypothetical protein
MSGDVTVTIRASVVLIAQPMMLDKQDICRRQGWLVPQPVFPWQFVDMSSIPHYNP